MNRIFFNTVLLVYFFSLSSLEGQNISGHWFGIGNLQTNEQYSGYLSEIIFRQKGKIITGELNYYFKDSLIKVSLNGNFDPTSQKLSIKPFPIIYYQSPNAKNSIDCIMSGEFTLIASKTESVLTGILKADADHRYTVPNINFRLTKSDDTAALVMREEPEEDLKTKVVNLPLSAAITVDALIIREKFFTKELDIENPTIQIELYDNGEIDYDSVSLFLNNKLILPKTMLTHKAIRLKLTLDASLEYNELSMFAENLGMKPPNTAALIIYDGKTRFETLLTSDLSKTATIKLKNKK